jgi:hypothetical protein
VLRREAEHVILPGFDALSDGSDKPRDNQGGAALEPAHMAPQHVVSVVGGQQAGREG